MSTPTIRNSETETETEINDKLRLAVAAHGWHMEEDVHSVLHS